MSAAFTAGYIGNALHFGVLLRRSAPHRRRKHRRSNEKLPPLHSILTKALGTTGRE
jgi:hypothetical protein